MKTYEKQLLIENETKLNAIQARLDWYRAECYGEDEIPKELISEFYRLLDRVQTLKKELSK
jgi:hypothetical protein